jgi:hypothetical protein
MNLQTFKPSYFFKRLKLWSFQKKYPQAPWLTEAAVYFLNSWLKPTDIGFEWGSGRSTVWFAERTQHLVSIEHHKGWYENVSKMLADKGISQGIDYFHIDLNESYENKINEYEQRFDYVLVDGRRRLKCFKQAISQVKPGGILILDNSDRYVPNNIMGSNTSVVNKLDTYKNTDWEETIKLLQSWRRVHTSDGINDTSFWVKPNN